MNIYGAFLGTLKMFGLLFIDCSTFIFTKCKKVKVQVFMLRKLQIVQPMNNDL